AHGPLGDRTLTGLRPDDDRHPEVPDQGDRASGDPAGRHHDERRDRERRDPHAERLTAPCAPRAGERDGPAPRSVVDHVLSIDGGSRRRITWKPQSAPPKSSFFERAGVTAHGRRPAYP